MRHEVINLFSCSPDLSMKIVLQTRIRDRAHNNANRVPTVTHDGMHMTYNTGLDL